MRASDSKQFNVAEDRQREFVFGRRHAMWLGAVCGGIIALAWLGVRIVHAWEAMPTERNLILLFGILHAIVEIPLGTLLGLLITWLIVRLAKSVFLAIYTK